MIHHSARYVAHSKVLTRQPNPFLNQGWKSEAWFIHECGLNCDGNEDKCNDRDMDSTSIRETKGFEMQSKGIHIPQKGALAFLLVKSTLLDIHVFLVLKGK